MNDHRRTDARIDHSEPYALANVLLRKEAKWDWINFGCTLALAVVMGYFLWLVW